MKVDFNESHGNAYEPLAEYVRKAIEWLLQVTRQKGLLLDLGCGTGSIFESILRKRKDIMVVGVDVSLQALCRGVERKHLLGLQNREYVACDICNLPFRPRSFDSAMCHEVLHHCADLDSVLVEVRSALKKSGYIVFVEKTRNLLDISAKFFLENIRGLRMVFYKLRDHADWTGQHPFTIYRSTFEYEKALSEHGFLITSRVYHGLLVDWLEYIVRRWFRRICTVTLFSQASLFEDRILIRFHGAICNNVCFCARLNSAPQTALCPKEF